jgi:hypothetical protein
VPTINLSDEELAALTALLRRAVEEDRFPLAPRLLPLRSALAKLEAAPKLTQTPRSRQAASAAPDLNAKPLL